MLNKKHVELFVKLHKHTVSSVFGKESVCKA